MICHIAPFRDDGKTYGTLTWIWSVVVDGALYVRAYNGTQSMVVQAAISQKAGRITVAGSERKKSPSSRSMARSTSASMMRTARNTAGAHISHR